MKQGNEARCADAFPYLHKRNNNRVQKLPSKNEFLLTTWQPCAALKSITTCRTIHARLDNRVPRKSSNSGRRAFRRETWENRAQYALKKGNRKEACDNKSNL